MLIPLLIVQQDQDREAAEVPMISEEEKARISAQFKREPPHIRDPILQHVDDDATYSLLFLPFNKPTHFDLTFSQKNGRPKGFRIPFNLMQLVANCAAQMIAFNSLDKETRGRLIRNRC